MSHTFTLASRSTSACAPHEPQFHWRGHEVTRLEGFTDAVFAFAVTLLIVALEVPHTFDGLLDVLRGFPAFVICFAILMTFCNAHYTFFRATACRTCTRAC